MPEPHSDYQTCRRRWPHNNLDHLGSLKRTLVQADERVEISPPGKCGRSGRRRTHYLEIIPATPLCFVLPQFCTLLFDIPNNINAACCRGDAIIENHAPEEIWLLQGQPVSPPIVIDSFMVSAIAANAGGLDVLPDWRRRKWERPVRCSRLVAQGATGQTQR